MSNDVDVCIYIYTYIIASQCIYDVAMNRFYYVFSVLCLNKANYDFIMGSM